MGMTADQYREALQALLPPGIAWTREDGTRLTTLLDAWAQEFGRLDARADALIEETDPRTALELLPDWERAVGLPDECTGIAEGIPARRLGATAKLTMRGGQRPGYFVELAAALGFTVAIDEFTSFDAGADVGTDLNGDDWRHTWRVRLESLADLAFTEFVAGSLAGEPLLSWGAADLECVIRRAKPAHSVVLFAYPAEPEPIVDLDFTTQTYLLTA